MMSQFSFQFIEDSDDQLKSNLLIVLFHGYGADAYDLLNLKEAIQIPSQYKSRWIFPQGIINVPIGPGWMGRAWWPIDLEALEKSSFEENERELSHKKPGEIEILREVFFKWIAQQNYSWNQIILGGFSQGAMLAIDLFLQAPSPPKALISFSGALINEKEWQQAPLRQKSKCFLSHGLYDPILSFKNLDLIHQLLKSKGAEVYISPFSGNHEIPPQVIKNLNEWLLQF